MSRVVWREVTFVLVYQGSFWSDPMSKKQHRKRGRGSPHVEHCNLFCGGTLWCIEQSSLKDKGSCFV
ncbi:hypothetical protein SUGI_0872460 [Cryptomeria japonica]|nr:hypothetical protein SUGI_0872460 [Cryptomeria japonica]